MLHLDSLPGDDNSFVVADIQSETVVNEVILDSLPGDDNSFVVADIQSETVVNGVILDNKIIWSFLCSNKSELICSTRKIFLNKEHLELITHTQKRCLQLGSLPGDDNSFVLADIKHVGSTCLFVYRVTLQCTRKN